MVQITTLEPHDAVPSGPGKHVVVLRRFQEDGPGGTATQIILTGPKEEVTHPRGPDGKPMPFDQAIRAAVKVAESEGLNRIFVLDRMQGTREADILRHDGDHSVHMAHLSDTNDDQGDRGPDMRDIAHPRPTP